MKYAAIFQYPNDIERVRIERPRHRDYLARLRAEGKLAMAGPFPDESGALIIYEASSAVEAVELIRADPFYEAGVFRGWTLREWNQVF